MCWLCGGKAEGQSDDSPRTSSGLILSKPVARMRPEQGHVDQRFQNGCPGSNLGNVLVVFSQLKYLILPATASPINIE